MKRIFVLAALSVAAWADSAGPATIAGKVLDPSGAAVPGAEVTLTSPASAAVKVTTDRDGRFAAPDLGPGPYDVTATAAGFAPGALKGVEARGGRTSVADVHLAIATVSEQMTVTAKAPASEGAFETRPQNTREILEIREARESAAKDVGEAISRLEGLSMIRKGGVANDIVLRGFQQGNIGVLIDGVRINGACPNHMDPAAFHVDFAEVENVHVTKGPFDIRNQGTIGGTVDVITKPRTDRLKFTPNLAAGSFGFWNPSLEGSYGWRNLYIAGGYSRRRSGMYHDGSGRHATDYANFKPSRRDENAFDINTGWSRVGLTLPKNQKLDFSYTRQQGGLTLYPYLLMDAIYDNVDRAGASWEIREPAGAIRRAAAQAYWTRVRHWMTDELRSSSDGAARPYGMSTFAATKTFGLRAEAELPGTFVGVESYRRTHDAVNTMRMGMMYMDQSAIPRVNITVAGLYAQHRRVWGRFQATAAGRYDVAQSEARPNDLDKALYTAYHGNTAGSRSDRGASGTVFGSYAARAGVELFAGAATAMRLPDPQERWFALKRGGSDWAGNPGLNPTRNNEVDAGVNIRAGRVTLRPTAFYSRLDDFTTVAGCAIRTPTPGIVNTGARCYENVQARVYGGEMSYSVGITRSVLFAGGASYTRGELWQNSGGAGKPIAEMPPLKSRASLRYGSRLFFAEVEGRAVARQDRVDRQLLEQPTPGYGLLGMKGGVHHGRIQLTGGVDNLLDRFYYDHLSFQRDPFRTGVRIPDPGRTIYVNLSFVFE